MNVLVTGATGFIGRRLCARLCGEGLAAAVVSDWGDPARHLVVRPGNVYGPEAVTLLASRAYVQGGEA